MQNVGKKLTKKDFANIIGQVWNSIHVSTICNGFKKTGIYPFDKHAIPQTKFDVEKLKRYEVTL